MTNNSQILIKKKPFGQELDEKSFYYFPALKQRLMLLNSLFAGKSRLALIIGEAGSGKTLLVKQFLALNEKDWKKCRINANDPLATEGNALPGHLHEHPAYINSKSELPVIIMDNAGNLNSEELLFLVKMVGVKGYTRSLKQLIFCCEPGMIQSLTSLENAVPEDNTLEKIYMPSLTQNETKEYIERRLCATGYTGRQPFTRQDINNIYKKSGGIPGKINSCASAHLEKKSEEKKTIVSFFKNMIKN